CAVLTWNGGNLQCSDGSGFCLAKPQNLEGQNNASAVGHLAEESYELAAGPTGTQVRHDIRWMAFANIKRAGLSRVHDLWPAPKVFAVAFGARPERSIR